MENNWKFQDSNINYLNLITAKLSINTSDEYDDILAILIIKFVIDFDHIKKNYLALNDTNLNLLLTVNILIYSIIFFTILKFC